MDSSPRKSLDSTRQTQIGEYLGDLGVDCFCCKNPASNSIIEGQQNRRQISSFSKSDRPLQSTDAKPSDKTLAALSRKEDQERRIPSWEKDPPPLEGWSADEQHAFINELSKSPRDLRHRFEHRQLVYTKLLRSDALLEGRTLSECEECYEHIQANRIAYFGPTQHKRTPHHGGSLPAVRPER